MKQEGRNASALYVGDLMSGLGSRTARGGLIAISGQIISMRDRRSLMYAGLLMLNCPVAPNIGTAQIYPTTTPAMVRIALKTGGVIVSIR